MKIILWKDGEKVEYPSIAEAVLEHGSMDRYHELQDGTDMCCAVGFLNRLCRDRPDTYYGTLSNMLCHAAAVLDLPRCRETLEAINDQLYRDHGVQEARKICSNWFERAGL
jgi:hypothetical protein